MRERHFGVFQGRRDIERDDAIAKSGIDPRLYKPAGGGESKNQVMERAKSYILDTIKKGFKRVLVVAHGQFITEFLNAVKTLSGGTLVSKDSIKNCSLTIIEFK